MIRFLIRKGKCYRKFKDKFNHRQEVVVARIFRAGIEGFRRGLSAKNFMTRHRRSKYDSNL